MSINLLLENDDDPVVLPEGTIRLQALNSEYSTGADMGYSSAVSHSFLLMFATEECEVVMGQPFGTGEIVVLELCSESAEDLLPAEGTYKIGDDIKDGCIVAGFDFVALVLQKQNVWFQQLNLIVYPQNLCYVHILSVLLAIVYHSVVS